MLNDVVVYANMYIYSNTIKYAVEYEFENLTYINYS